MSGGSMFADDVEISQVGTLVAHDLKTSTRGPWSTWTIATPIRSAGEHFKSSRLIKMTS